MKRKFLASLLAVCMALGLLPVTARAAEVASGDCGAEGSNLKWTLDDAGTLTISGTGAMKDYGVIDNPSPWGIGHHTLVIGEGVTPSETSRSTNAPT